jgi:hypothetical protein
MMCPTPGVGFASESRHPSETLARLLWANAGHHQDDARAMQLVGGHSLMIFFALR